jgi:transposase InsO family protein
MKFRFIAEHTGEFRIGKMCQILEVSRGGYHNYIKQRLTQRKLANIALLALIKKIWENSKRTYGTPRIHADLRAMGLKINRKRVERIMRANRIAAKTKRKFKVTTDSSHNLPVLENLVKQNFNPKALNKLWASDITYIWTKEGWLYLAIVMDLFSRKVIGWSMSNRIKGELVEKAVRRALSNRNPDKDLIFHSDQGSQYCSYKVRKLLSDNDIIQSMSRKGNCYDNAVVESFFHTLKTELIKFKKYENRAEARSDIFEYIEMFYNRVRRHSTLGYLSPLDYENKSVKLAA